MQPATSSRKVHLVGSVNLGSAEEVFTTASRILGERVSRLPDGETGARAQWTWWQAARLAADPRFEPAPPAAYGRWSNLTRVAVRDGVTDLTFDAPGYAAFAAESYEIFSRLKSAGTVAPHVRLLVALPTPYALLGYVAAEHRARVEPEIVRGVLDDLAQVVAAIPHDEAAIQWDICNEMVAVEGLDPPHFDDPVAGCADRIREITEAVPDDVEVGWHFCYGSYFDEHFIEPRSTELMVELANESLRGLRRTVDYLHFPVPIERSDDEYFAPLAGLTAPAETEVFLGLVHFEDGVEGARTRLAAADRHLPGCGIGTECGMGRCAAGATMPLLELHAAVADLHPSPALTASTS